MGRLLPMVAVVVLTGSAALANAETNVSDQGRVSRDSAKFPPPAVVYSAPEFHAAGAAAALTLLLGGVAVLKGWRRP